MALYGCQSTTQLPNDSDGSVVVKPTQPKNARTDAYAALKKRYPTADDRSAQKLLANAKASMDDGDDTRAALLIAQLQGLPSAIALRDVYFRLLARTAIQTADYHQAALALSDVRDVLPNDLNLISKVCEELRARNCLLQLQVINQQLANRFTLESQNRIWSALQSPDFSRASATSPNRLIIARLLDVAKTLPGIASQLKQIDDTVAGWISLRDVIAQSESPRAALARWNDWQQQNPSHTATLTTPEALRRLSVYQRPNIAVMLPLSGRLSSAGKAVRDGLTTGFFADQTPSASPMPISADSAESKPGSLTFLDSNQYTNQILLTQASNNNSHVLIGPLAKSRAQAFYSLLIQTSTEQAQSATPTTHILLNRVQEPLSTLTMPVSRFVYQFAAAIEDEALTLSQVLKARGHNRVIVVANKEPWADRANKALIQDWHGAVSLATFNRPREITGAVGIAMGVADSQSRRKELESLLNEELEFLPRERKDVDAVVAFTNSLEAEALVPALKFHFADELPVFATSQTTRSNNLQELAGFNVTALPLLASPNDIEQGMADTFELEKAPLVALYALGLDAYRIATWTHWLALHNATLDKSFQIRLESASGDLILGLGGRIQRQLAVTRIDRRGNLQVQDQLGD